MVCSYFIINPNAFFFLLCVFFFFLTTVFFLSHDINTKSHFKITLSSLLGNEFWWDQNLLWYKWLLLKVKGKNKNNLRQCYWCVDVLLTGPMCPVRSYMIRRGIWPYSHCSAQSPWNLQALFSIATGTFSAFILIIASLWNRPSVFYHISEIVPEQIA